MEKAELEKKAADVRAAWESTLEALGTDLLELPGATGEWRVRDVLAHCNGWDRWQTVQLRCAFSGETPTDLDLTGGIRYPANDDMHPDAMNAMFIAGTRDLPAAEILHHWREINAMRADWISAATQAQLDQIIGADWSGGSARIVRLASEVPSVSNPAPAWQSLLAQLEHQEMHLGLIRQWMERQASAV